MGQTSETCHYCDRPAEYLCDFVLSRKPYRTCDRPLCREHAVNRGHMHLCRRGRGGGCTVDTIDYCPGHAHGLPGKPPYVPVGGGRAG